MKQRILIVGLLLLLVGVLIALNATAYVQKPKVPDSEFAPNRSTYNSGATGTLALFSLLSETKRKVIRWQEPPVGLLAVSGYTPGVFVVIGSVRREFTRAECSDLLRWTARGGRLVIIDRDPPRDFTTDINNWNLKFDNPVGFEIMSVDPTDQKAMIGDTAASRPILPTTFTADVNAVQPSRFAAAVSFNMSSGVQHVREERVSDIPPPDISTGNAAAPAPVSHIGGGKNILVDLEYGTGRIVYLSDPYLVTNAGIAAVDNIQLALNILDVGDEVIAFDEFHQGYGANNNRFLTFFEGTPIVAIFLQAAVLVGLVLFSQSRRFGRAVPEAEPDRLAKLEYISAMAELQRRIKAFDLALENIYTEFRRRAVRLSGTGRLANPRSEVAAFVAERTGRGKTEIEDAMTKCEAIIQGEPTNQGEILRLVRTVRELEEKMGMTRASGAKTSR